MYQSKNPYKYGTGRRKSSSTSMNRAVFVKRIIF